MCRIGYPCYQLYTYYKNVHTEENWRKKISALLHSQFENEDMKYGTANEPVALKIFQENVDGTVYRCGFLVNKYLRCLGYSPDGFLLTNGELHLLEVKCPKKGRGERCDVMVSQLPYIVSNKNNPGEGELRLRKKHQYYGQIQLGLYLTGLSFCHLLVYNGYESKNVEILVARDNDFQEVFVQTLIHVFFEKYLPYLQTYY